ncbi:MAG: hypothetical protein A2Z16_11625 [Chloroflexi bacterium RBG_16_54_18]|nr:MAG: hypothetical protein A2Z16_11625 [Chloroflexi bacterium RBG_16_54_18]
MDADQLIAQLNNLGLRYLIGEKIVVNEEVVSPDRLLAALSGHPDARIRHALIALLLFRPDFSDFANNAIEHLTEDEKFRFKFQYTAAMLLQQIHTTRLRQYVNNWIYIPDRFSMYLQLPETGTPWERLQKLAELQRNESGLTVNWAGTYNNIAERLITRFESELAWAVWPQTRSEISS